MNRTRIPIAGLLVVVAILAVAFTMIGRPDRMLLTLWNLVVWGLPTIAILWAYGSDRLRTALLTVSASLLQIVLLLALVAGSATLLVGLDLITGSHVGPWRHIVLLTPSVLWSIGSSLLILAIVTRYALRVRGRRRTFAVGFALTGWPILLAGFAPLWGEDVPVLWTSEVLHDLSGLPEPAPLCLALYEINCTTPGSGTFLFSAVLEEDSTLPSRYSSLPVGVRITGAFLARYLQYQIIGHCVVTLAIATAAGWLARTLAARRNAPTAPASASDPEREPSSAASPVASLLGTSRQVFPGSNS